MLLCCTGLYPKARMTCRGGGCTLCSHLPGGQKPSALYLVKAESCLCVSKGAARQASPQLGHADTRAGEETKWRDVSSSGTDGPAWGSLDPGTLTPPAQARPGPYCGSVQAVGQGQRLVRADGQQWGSWVCCFTCSVLKGVQVKGQVPVAAASSQPQGGLHTAQGPTAPPVQILGGAATEVSRR